MHYFTSCSLNRLTWQDGTIPGTEIWVKIGGDKGGDKVKLFFQICNVPAPNSVNNTCVFCIFEGRDTATNLHIALDRYTVQIKHLAEQQWRYIVMDNAHIHKHIHYTV